MIALLLGSTAYGRAADTAGGEVFPRPLASYHDGALGVGAKLLDRIHQDPFNLLATVLFLGAIIHTFLASRFMAVSHRYQRDLEALGDAQGDAATREAHDRLRDQFRFRAQLFHFMGEIEAVFGIWAVPLGIALAVFKGWPVMVDYFARTSYAEPVFVVVVMAIAASRPVLTLAEACLARVAALGGSTPAAWWLSILTVGPLLGSFITEPAAMTICALLLRRRFYELKPDPVLQYATLGLLFVNISVGGTLTHFAAPPVVMVARTWGWDLSYLFTHFGWKAIIGIVGANAAHFVILRGRFRRLSTGTWPETTAPIPVPAPITLVHLLFIAWTVLTSHYPPLVVLGFLFFLAFVEATERHQSPIQLRGPLLVGFFLAALVLHGGGQQWWIAPVLGSLDRWPLMIGATALTAVNDNAAITYLASLVPDFSEVLRYAVVAGAVVGGGLTVIANAPNPAGQSILQAQFGDGGISPLKLFLGALAPTVIVGLALALL
ncbi:putative Na+/H+ antiporter [Chthoniobacter flavus]|uniref:putative Na+/H+ antiporter n=1 Tax=Chthoniobacter flavus TaxID=191863 RepID=UPI0012F72B01|nr:putative Na+/H+ antiporter [Chthoniobacter flavus]